MKKRIVAAMLALTLGIYALAGCGNGKEAGENGESGKSGESSQEAEQPKAEQPEESSREEGADVEIAVDHFAGTELEIAIIRRDSDKEGNFDEKPIVKRTEEATGIHINWIVIDQAAVADRVTTMLASNQQPDAYMGMVGYDTVAQNKDMFYDVSALLPVWAPNVYSDYVNGGQGVLDMITMSDGSVRNLVGNVGASFFSEAQGLWYINQKWLESLNMEIPTTADEFYEVLCAFRDNDMNGNGDVADEIPLAFADNDWCACFLNYANAFGIAGHDAAQTAYYKMVKDGVVQGTAHTQEYRAFLEFFHKLKEEGLMDVEGFSQTTEQYMAKIAEERVGIFIAWDPASAGAPTPEDYVAMAPFRGMDGVEPVKTGAKNYFFGHMSGMVPTASCKNIEALLHWWNYMSSTLENKLMAGGGEEGIGYYYDENGKLWSGIDPAKADEDVDYKQLSYNQQIGNTTRPYMTPEDVMSTVDHDTPKRETIRGRGCVLVDDMTLQEYIPTKMVSAEAETNRTFIETDLFPIISSFRAKSVMEGVTDESWDAYLAELETYRYYEWIQWWQDYKDGKF